MVQISTNQFKKGMSLIVDGNLVDIVEFQFVKPGKGGAFVRTKLKNMKTGAVLEKTFDSKERVEQAHIDKRQWEYLYRDGDAYVFMDNETYDQTSWDTSGKLRQTLRVREKHPSPCGSEQLQNKYLITANR